MAVEFICAQTDPEVGSVIACPKYPLEMSCFQGAGYVWASSSFLSFPFPFLLCKHTGPSGGICQKQCSGTRKPCEHDDEWCFCGKSDIMLKEKCGICTQKKVRDLIVFCHHAGLLQCAGDLTSQDESEIGLKEKADCVGHCSMCTWVWEDQRDLKTRTPSPHAFTSQLSRMTR